MKRIAAAVIALITVGIVAGILVPHTPPVTLAASPISSNETIDASTAGHVLVAAGMTGAGATASENSTTSSGSVAGSTNGVPLSDLLGVVGLLGAAGVTVGLCLRPRRERPSSPPWDSPQSQA
jgi:hypothetical protein